MTDKNSTVVLPEEVENITPGVSSVSGQADLFDEVLSGDIANLRPRVAGDDETDDPLDAIAREANDDSQEQNRSERNLTSHATTHTGSRRDMDVNGYISDDEETLVTSSGLEERRQVSDIQETGGEVVTQAQSGSVSVDRSEVSVERQEQRSGLVETEDEDNEDADGTDESISVEDQEITAWRGDRRRRDSDEEYTQPDGEESDALVEETLEPEILDAVVLPTEERHADIAPISDGLSALSVAPVTVPETAAGAVVPLTISYEEKDGKEATTFAISLKDAPAGTQVGYRDGKGTFIEVPGGTLDETQVTTAAVKVPAHWSGAFRATVTATSTDAGAPSSAKAEPQTVAVKVTPVSDGLSELKVVAPVPVAETAAGAVVPLTISYEEKDGKEATTFAISLKDAPDGTQVGYVKNGTFVAVPGGTLDETQVTTAAVKVPAHSSGAFQATVAATSTEAGAPSSAKAEPQTVAVKVTPVVSGIENVSLPGSITGKEDENGSDAFSFGLSLDLKDKDGSERVDWLRFENVPVGFTLKSSRPSDTIHDHGSGVIDWSGGDLGKPVAGRVSVQNLFWELSSHKALPKEQQITVSALIRDGLQIAGKSDSYRSDVSRWKDLGSFSFDVKPVPDAPDKDPVHVSGDEDTWIPIGFPWSSPDRDGSETLLVTLSGFPKGTSVSYEINGRPYDHIMDGPTEPLNISSEEHRKLKVKAPENSDGDFELKASIKSQEKDTKELSEVVESSVRVSVRGVADGTGHPRQTYTRTGQEDKYVPLELNEVSSRDADGSEGVSYQLDLSGVARNYPDYVLSAGGSSDLVALPGQPHYFAVGKGALAGLSLFLGPDAAGVVSIPVQAVFTEREGDVRVESHTLQVTVEPVPDVPVQASLSKPVELVPQGGGIVLGPVVQPSGHTSPVALLPKSDDRDNEDRAASFLPLPENAREDTWALIPLKATPRDSDSSEKVSAVSLTTEMENFDVCVRGEDGTQKSLVWNETVKSYVVEGTENSNLVSFSELWLHPRGDRTNLGGEKGGVRYALSFTLDDGDPDKGGVSRTFELERVLKVDPVADAPVVEVSQVRTSKIPLPVIGSAAGLRVVLRSGEAREAKPNDPSAMRKEGSVNGKIYVSDGSEAVHLVISGMKPGAVLLDRANNVIGHNNGEGSWFLDAQVIDGLRNPVNGSIRAGAIQVWAPPGVLDDNNKLKLQIEAIAVEKEGTSSDAIRRVEVPEVVVSWQAPGVRGASGGMVGNRLSLASRYLSRSRNNKIQPEEVPQPKVQIKDKAALVAMEDGPLFLSGVSVVTDAPLRSYTSLSAVILVPRGFLLAGHIPLSKVEPYGENQKDLPEFAKNGKNPGYTSYVVPGGDLSHLSVIPLSRRRNIMRVLCRYTLKGL